MTVRYDVFNDVGAYVREGDKLVSFRGEVVTFIECAHPRKIYVENAAGQRAEYYPGVFNVRIEEVR